MGEGQSNAMRVRTLFAVLVVLVVFLVTATFMVSSAHGQGPFAWVSQASFDQLKVIDTATNTVIATIPVTLGIWPWHIAFTPNGRYAYVSCDHSDNVVVFDTSTRTEVTSIPVGGSPKGIKVTPDGAYVYVTNRKDDSVSVIRTSDHTVTGNIPVGDNPYTIAITPDGAYAYVTNKDDDTISVIRLSDHTVVDTYSFGHLDLWDAWGIAITPDGQYAYVSNRFDYVTVIRLSDKTIVVPEIDVGGSPHGIAVTPDGRYVYVSNHVSSNVSVIRTSDNTVIATVDVHGEPWDVAITPDSAYAYVTNSQHPGEEGVEVIRTSDNTVIATVNLGAGTYGQRGIAIQPLAETPLQLIGILESPANNQNVSGITTIHGWALDGKKVTKVELFVDGTYAADIPYGGSRNDVEAVYPHYPNAHLSGFGIILNYSILSSGSHTILVRLHNQDGQTKDLTATVMVVKFHGEFVTNVVPDGFWFNDVGVTTEGVTKTYDIQTQWSNERQGFEIRESVLKEGSSLNQRQENDLHPILTSSQMISRSLSSEPLSSLPLIGHLENPSDGEKVSGLTTIHGWALDGKKVTKVELFVDGTYAADIPYGGSREDVRAVYPEYPDAHLSGFGMVLNYSTLSSGSHAILVRLHNQDGQTQDLTATVTVVRFNGEFVTNVTPASQWLYNVAVTADGTTRNYDIKIEWSNSSQGFRITEVVEK